MKRIIKFLICLFVKIKNVGKLSISVTATVLGKCIFEGKNVIGRHTRLRNCELGYGTYIGDNSSFANAKIGRFCSIASNVRLIDGAHPIDNAISTHPAFYSTNRKFFNYINENKFDETMRTSLGYCAEIGNDVWIGSDVLIKSGVKIWDGAVVAMGAVVTKDVPPYAVVGGVPAKIIKYRFNDSEIEQLVKLDIWNKPVAYYEENADRFMDARKFINEETQNEGV